jgi:hypothetical protein
MSARDVISAGCPLAHSHTGTPAGLGELHLVDESEDDWDSSATFGVRAEMQCRPNGGEHPSVDDLDVDGGFVPGHGDFDRVKLRRSLERIRDRFGGRELEVETLPLVEPALLTDALQGRAQLSRGRRPAVELQIDVRILPRQNATPPYLIEYLMC